MATQTQPEVTSLMTDIFGDSDDDDDQVVTTSAKLTPQSGGQIWDSDDGLNDSDEDVPQPVAKKQSSGQKQRLLNKKRHSSQSLEDSDDDGQESNLTIKKRRPPRKEQSSTSKEKKKDADADSGDEYASETDEPRTKDDDEFIAEDDDMAEVTKEYNEEDQNFRDERPENTLKAQKKSKSANNDALRTTVNKNATDPLSQTMMAMKKQKEQLISEADKERFVADLLEKMSIAAMKDEILYEREEPAINKLILLEAVQRAIGIRDLHYTMLEGDMLGRLKEWIEPKKDKPKTLPSLALRTAVYDILDKLPCQTEHLKKSAIGITIVSLKKHAEETAANKRTLKNLMEKWCRPLFAKSTDVRHSNIRQNEELNEAAAQQKTTVVHYGGGPNAKSAAVAAAAGGGAAAADLHALLGGGKHRSQQQKEIDLGKNRVRTPYTSGYVFTVQAQGPQGATAGSDKTNSGGNPSSSLSESRQKLYKQLKERPSNNTSRIDTKLKSVSMSLTGRDKA